MTRDKPPHETDTARRAPALGGLLCEPLFCVGAVLFCLFLITAIAGGFFAPNDPLKTNLSQILSPPSRQYPLGTDNLGRCVLSRLIAGCKTTLGTALATEAAILAIGLAVGTAAGYLGGILDSFVLIVIDTLLSFPSLILALVIAGILGQGLGNLMAAMIAVYWVEYARLARSMTKTVREKTFVTASIASGSAPARVILAHILPHILPGMLVYAALGVPSIIIGISSLSFIGLGVRAPYPEWGAMVNEARVSMSITPVPLTASVFCILLSVICFQLLGEAARAKLSPRQSQLGTGKPAGKARKKAEC